MKITGGFLKGKTFLGPPKGLKDIRPLRTRIRKALFDILGEDLTGLRVLDLFAGTGALGIEALSRGAESVVFVDASQRSIELIKKNLQRLNLTSKSQVMALRLPKDLPKVADRYHNQPFELVFITPPYRSGLALSTLTNLPARILGESSLVVVEEETSVSLPNEISCFELEDRRTYGETTLHFYRITKKLLQADLFREGTQN